MHWSQLDLVSILRWFGAGLSVLGGGLLIWTMKTLGRNLTDTVVTRKNATLVTNGPYHWVRHPFYLAFALSVVATSLLAANWFLFTGGTAAFWLILLRTQKEEANLVSRFGDEYLQYMKKTGQFLPRFHR